MATGRIEVRPKDDSGIALIVTLLVLMLMAALMAGFFAAVNADNLPVGLS